MMVAANINEQLEKRGDPLLCTDKKTRGMNLQALDGIDLMSNEMETLKALMIEGSQ